METWAMGSRRTMGDVLTVGFGTSVAMWAIGYLGRIPPVIAPSWLIGMLMLGCIVVGGWVAGRFGPRGVRGGVLVGALSALLNLLILGSLLSGGGVNHLRPSAWLWLPGSIVGGVVLAACGAWLGARRADGRAAARNWTGAFALVAAFATLTLLVVGGVVTSEGAGLTVADWPNSFGYNMFLYPLSRMTGGVYFEHAHRLFGSLVGLTTIVLAIHLHRADPRRWLRRLSMLAIVIVATQGLLGGLRVTGRLTFSASRAVMEPSVALALVHGVLGQLFFALMVAIAGFTTTTWRSAGPARPTRSAAVDHALTAILVGVLMVQLVLGAEQRHFDRGLMIHITLAVVVLLLVVAVGVRTLAAGRQEPILGRIGRTLVVVGCVQITLGFGALAAVMTREGETATRLWDVAVRTAHQATGALLLATATLAAIWTRRLLRPPEG
jgi:heme A synthase